jgi:hypothetical protein
MMENTSKLMEFDRVSRKGHEECQRGGRPERMGEKEKKGVNNQDEERSGWYRYANCSPRYFLRMEFKRLGVWDSRVRVQDILTEDTGRGHSLGSEIEGWFASV